MTAVAAEDVTQLARRLLSEGYSLGQIKDRTKLSADQIRAVAQLMRGGAPAPVVTAVDVLRMLTRAMRDSPDPDPAKIAAGLVGDLSPELRGPVLVHALALLIRKMDEPATPLPAVRQEAIRQAAPVRPSRKTEIVKDLVRARLDCRVVVDGQSLRFAECTREQVLALYDKTRDAAAALMAHAVWLSSVSESMLMHRAATVGELPAEPRAALMEAKPE